MRLVTAVLVLLMSVAATGQAGTSIEKISLDVPAAAYKRGNQIAGELRIPDSKRERLPAVVIGVMGFSWGGQVVLVGSSAKLRDEYGQGTNGFAAHLALYPQCWRIRTAQSGKDPLLSPPLFDAVAGGPVHILAGEGDGYDGPDGCKLFIDWLPATTRANYSVTIYEGATFAWDHKFGGVTYEAGGRRGQGGMVEVVADPQLAATSRGFAVRYFLSHLDSRCMSPIALGDRREASA